MAVCVVIGDKSRLHSLTVGQAAGLPDQPLFVRHSPPVWTVFRNRGFYALMPSNSLEARRGYGGLHPYEQACRRVAVAGRANPQLLMVRLLVESGFRDALRTLNGSPTPEALNAVTWQVFESDGRPRFRSASEARCPTTTSPVAVLQLAESRLGRLKPGRRYGIAAVPAASNREILERVRNHRQQGF